MNLTALLNRLDRTISNRRESPPTAEPILNDEIHAPAWFRFPQTAGNGAGQRSQVHGFALHLDTRQTRKLQQIVDEKSHALRFGANAIQILVRVSVERGPVVFQQRQAPAVDPTQRRAKIVRHRIGEGFQLLVGGLELDGAVLNALFQLPVELPDFLLRALFLRDIPLHFQHSFPAIRPSTSVIKLSTTILRPSIICVSSPRHRPSRASNSSMSSHSERVTGVKQLVRYAADRFPRSETVQLLGAMIPVFDRAS